ncbi:hypothetical protein AB0C59_08435 [Streptomyces sp. NPDC048664]|uniref:RCC1 domain-containing protein n=1 Tax=Streptomyces sp. NPDC048664 TaxID=3154505 RepID=UPI0034143F71
MVFARVQRLLGRRVPTVVLAALMATGAAVSAGQTAAAAPPVPGTVQSWGANTWGQLGDGTTTGHSNPVQVCGINQTLPCAPLPHDVVSVSAGGAHSLALRRDGTVLAWGLNDLGQLGDGTSGVFNSRSTPVRVCAVGQTAPCTRFLTDVVAVAAGGSHSLALRRDGTVVAWGFNGLGQLGNATAVNQATPVPVCAVGQSLPCTRELTNVHAISAGNFDSLALRRDGTVVAWGQNNNGELGDGTAINRATPVRVCAVGQSAPCTRFLAGVTSLDAGDDHNLALMENGTVTSWGVNPQGELGDGTTTNRNTPVRVCAVGRTAPCGRLLGGVHAVSAGGSHSLALGERGTVTSWGANDSGQLGDGTTTDRSAPVRVCAIGQAAPCTRLLADVQAVSAGQNHSLALRGWSGVDAWGGNGDGQLGDATAIDRTTPVRVCAIGQTAPCARLLSHVHAVSAGGFYNLAVVR